MFPEKILQQLFDKNPYLNFDKKNLRLDIQTWGGNKKIFRKIIKNLNPELIIEIGSWKGASAINMGNYIKKKKINCKILCIDTWLGSLEHWDKRNENDKLHSWYTSLRLKNGYPTLYYQFLFNVIYSKLQDIIIPFPNTSSMASVWLKQRGIKADMIYIDGSHEELDVYSDLINYYPILKEGGIILGDDWCWPGVKNAVKRFIQERDLKLRLIENKCFWLIKK